MYVSYIVFGDQKAAFLLPWRRVFNLTDAQLFVARRDNARAIFSGYLAARGGELPAERCVCWGRRRGSSPGRVARCVAGGEDIEGCLWGAVWNQGECLCLLRGWVSWTVWLCADVSCCAVPRQYLRELRDYQQQIKLFDESAEEIVRDALRKQVGGLVCDWGGGLGEGGGCFLAARCCRIHAGYIHVAAPCMVTLPSSSAPLPSPLLIIT